MLKIDISMSDCSHLGVPVTDGEVKIQKQTSFF